MKQIIKKTWMFIALLCASFSAYAYDFKVDGIYYNVVSLEDMTCEVVKVDVKYMGDIVIPSEVTYNNRELSVISIGNYALSNNSTLTSVTIPNSVTRIGESAFKECSSLTQVIIGDSLTEIGRSAFQNCTYLVEINIPESVTVIDYQAFLGCNRLEKVEFASIESLLTIEYHGDSANPLSASNLYRASEITDYNAHLYINGIEISDVIVPNTITEIKPYSLSIRNINSVILPESVKKIEHNAFQESGLYSINIPESIKSIGQGAFFECKNLQKVEFTNIESLLTIEYEDYSANPLCAFYLDNESESIKYTNTHLYIDGKEISEVIIPNTMTEIKPYSLSIRNINTVIIPESVKKIEHNAFRGSGLYSINIPESIKNIGQDAFAGCNNLQKVEFASIESLCSMHYDYPNRVVDWGASNPLYYAKHLFINGVEITDLDIPETVIQICPFAFFGCKVLSSVNIPNSVIKIGEGAFGYCDGLSSVTIPKSVKLIDDNAFSDCKNLSSVIISDLVEKIGKYAFERCINLLSVTIPESIKSIGYLAFNNCINLEKIFYNTLNPISISKNNEIFDDEVYRYATLYVPAESLLKFDNVSPWRYFKHIEVDNSMSSVENPIEENIEYKVYTPDGKCMRSSLEELPAGLYIIRDKNRSKIIVKRGYK